MQLEIKRNTAVVASVEIDEKTVFIKKLMGEHKIRSEFYVEAPLNLQIGDYIEFRGEIFTINRVPEVEKINLKTFKYSIDFEGQIYALYNKLFMWDGIDEFSYTGTAADFLSLVVSNINQISSGWTSGSVDTTDEKTIYFEADSCRTALTRVAEAFGFEFALSGKQISLKKTIGAVTMNRFEYGRGKGLYSLTRQQVSDQNIVTRVYGFGGSKNIPYDYRNRAKKLVFETATGKRYLEKNTDLYGVIEARFIDENIYPKRTGTVTAALVNFGDMSTMPPDWPEFYIEDSSIDFDLNENLIEGETAKIVFKSGDMSGHEFDIVKYDHEAKRIYFNQFSDADGYTLPSDLNQPQIGDTYTLININMPQGYIDANELDLKNKTQEFLDQNCIPQVVYALNIDPRYVKSHGMVLDVGDMVTVVDPQLGIDSLIRTSELTFPLVNQNKINATIADFVPYTLQERVIKTSVQAKKETVFVETRSAELARRNTARLNQLKDYLLDQDGYFTMPIRPRSIETLYLSVGAVASDFRLNGAVFRENYNRDPNAFSASACSLTHLQPDLAYTWQISAGSFSGLTSGIGYWLYAKCSKTQLTGTWVLTSDVLRSDPGDGFYYFGTGVLLPVDENGIRSFETQYGKTYVNAREITTGRMQSIDKLNYMDLDSGQFNLGGPNSGVDWNVTNEDTLTIKGAIVQSPAGASFPIGVFRGVYNSSYTYYKGDIVTYGGSSWQYINNLSGVGKTPIEGQYWTKIASKGDQGPQGPTGTDGQDGANGTDGNFTEYRYAKNGSTTTPPSLSISELNPTGWSTTPPQTGVLEYLWFTKAVKNAAGTALIESWSSPVRIKGDAGADGAEGPAGPSPVYQGVYSSSKTYYGTSTRVDIVKYGSSYYVARADAGAFSGTTPTSTSKWNSFGSQFESVATDLLFASLAYIDNLGVKYLRTGTSGQRVFINGDDGSMRFYDSSNNEIMTLDNGIMTALGAVLNNATFRSSISGQRIEISSSTNELKFYNSSNQEIFSIDADGQGAILSGLGTVTMDVLSAFHYLRLQSYRANTQVPNGSIFLKSDGFVCYKDLSGNTYKLSRESY